MRGELEDSTVSRWWRSWNLSSWKSPRLGPEILSKIKNFCQQLHLFHNFGPILDSAHTILLRVDRHMDERSTSLRADPYDVSETYPHSGNGVTQECFILQSLLFFFHERE